MKSLFEKKLTEVTLENKLFSGMSLVAALTCFLTILIDLMSDFYPMLSLFVGIVGFLFLAFFYLSYFKGIIKPLLIPFYTIIFLALIANWFHYQGFGGSAPYYILAAVPILMFADYTNHHKAIFLSFVFLSLFLIVVQHLHPEWIKSYSSNETWLSDMSIGFMVALILLGSATLFLKKALDEVRQKTENRKSDLEYSEGRFKDVAMMSGEWIWELDTFGRFLYCSEKVESITGYVPSELLGKSFFEFLSKDKEAVTKLFMTMIQEKPRPFEHKEYWYWSKSGNLVCICSKGIPLYNSKAEWVGFRGVSVDITLQKTEKESNAWRQYFLDTLMENIPDAIYFKDREGRFLRINKALANRFDLSDPDEAIGKSDADFFNVEHAAETYLDEQNILRSGIPIITKEEHETWSDKPSTWVSTTKMPLMHEDGKVIGTFGISRDITDSKLMQEAIEKRILALTKPLTKEDSIDFKELFDLEHIQLIQDQFSNMSGVASIITETNGKPITKPSNFTRFCTDFVRKTEVGCINCEKSDASLGKPNNNEPNIRHCLSGGLWDAGTSIFIGEHHIANWLIGQVRDESQSEEAIRAYAQVLGVDETQLVEAYLEVPAMSLERFTHIAQALYTFSSTLSTSAYQNLQQARFIDERKQAEKALRYNEVQLKDLNATKDRFFSIIAHDLKSPFNSILGFTELLRLQLEEKNMVKAFEYCDVVEESAKNTMDLLNNLLEWSRSQTDKIEYNPQWLDLNPVVRESFDLLQHAAMHKNIRIILDMPSSANVWADKPMLSTILRNLTSNAIKFTLPGGAISISVEEKELDWLISVSDNGVGIHPDTLNNLFRIDVNVSTTGTKGERGTGLGLILCKEFVRKHNGVIYADSEPGKGSTFHFTLPKHPTIG